MHTDAATITGNRRARHAEANRDHAIAGTVEDHTHWGIVADGCSASGMTDVGARIWTLTLRRMFLRAGDKSVALCSDPQLLEANLIRSAASLLDVLDMGDGLATLCGVVVFGGRWQAFVAGDGALIARLPNGCFYVLEHEFTANLPLYLSYAYYRDMLSDYVRESEERDNELIVTRAIYGPDGQCIAMEPVERISAETAITSVIRSYDFTEMNPQALIACSDGVFSRPGVPRGQSVVDLAAPRLPSDEFLRRQLADARVAWQRQATLPEDDLSIAGVSV